VGLTELSITTNPDVVAWPVRLKSGATRRVDVLPRKNAKKRKT
jgi:hypothetical protein